MKAHEKDQRRMKEVQDALILAQMPAPIKTAVGPEARDTQRTAVHNGIKSCVRNVSPEGGVHSN